MRYTVQIVVEDEEHERASVRFSGERIGYAVGQSLKSVLEWESERPSCAPATVLREMLEMMTDNGVSYLNPEFESLARLLDTYERGNVDDDAWSMAMAAELKELSERPKD